MLLGVLFIHRYPKERGFCCVHEPQFQTTAKKMVLHLFLLSPLIRLFQLHFIQPTNRKSKGRDIFLFSDYCYYYKAMCCCSFRIIYESVIET
uniref:Uncharacterized protein n=1 Tax=Anopheles arabiensis TaxID=7173 RepID=A0A182IGG7_ANOAR